MVQITQDGPVARFRFSGQLSTTACDTLDAEISAALSKNPEAVVFDLADVTFIASMFLRLCLKTFKAMGRERFCVVHASPAVMKIFTIAGLDEMVKNN